MNSIDDNPSSGHPRLATETDFSIVDFEAPIRSCQYADAHQLYILYEQAFLSADQAQDEPKKAVFFLLGHICSVRLQPSNPGNSWYPLISQRNGNQSTLAENVSPYLAKMFATIAKGTANTVLKARLADLAWSNNKPDGQSAIIAVDTYCDLVHELLDGKLKDPYTTKANISAKTPMHRALQISALTTKRSSQSLKTIETFQRLYAESRSQGDIGVLVGLSELALEYHLVTKKDLASQLEDAANAVPEDIFPLAVRSAWDLAAGLYEVLKEPDSRQRCLLGAVTQTLLMRNQVTGAGAEAAWIMDALQRLRHIKGEEELKARLEADLRRLQKASINEMSTFDFDLNIGDAPKEVAAHFESLSLPEALRDFALLGRSRDPKKLRDEALETSRESPLMAMIPVSFIDENGRIITKSRGATSDNVPDDSWFTHMIDRSENIRRHRMVAGLIEPARLVMQVRFSLTLDQFDVLASCCPIVSELQRQIVALGFIRLFQGDFISATHLLVPQIEPLLRQILKINGLDPMKRSDDNTEEDLSIKNIYVRFGQALEKILGLALASEIERLFSLKPGPALRHEVAHGQLSGGDCYHPNVYYANWLIYRLCCLFILPDWDKLVAPQISEKT